VWKRRRRRRLGGDANSFNQFQTVSNSFKWFQTVSNSFQGCTRRNDKAFVLLPGPETTIFGC
jgi:hypothetical protein